MSQNRLAGGIAVNWPDSHKSSEGFNYQTKDLRNRTIMLYCGIA